MSTQPGEKPSRPHECKGTSRFTSVEGLRGFAVPLCCGMLYARQSNGRGSGSEAGKQRKATQGLPCNRF